MVSGKWAPVSRKITSTLGSTRVTRSIKTQFWKEDTSDSRRPNRSTAHATTSSALAPSNWAARRWYSVDELSSPTMDSCGLIRLAGETTYPPPCPSCPRTYRFTPGIGAERSRLAPPRDYATGATIRIVNSDECRGPGPGHRLVRSDWRRRSPSSIVANSRAHAGSVPPVERWTPSRWRGSMARVLATGDERGVSHDHDRSSADCDPQRREGTALRRHRGRGDASAPAGGPVERGVDRAEPFPA